MKTQGKHTNMKSPYQKAEYWDAVHSIARKIRSNTKTVPGKPSIFEYVRKAILKQHHVIFNVMEPGDVLQWTKNPPSKEEVDEAFKWMLSLSPQANMFAKNRAMVACICCIINDAHDHCCTMKLTEDVPVYFKLHWHGRFVTHAEVHPDCPDHLDDQEYQWNSLHEARNFMYRFQAYNRLVGEEGETKVIGFNQDNMVAGDFSLQQADEEVESK